MYPDLHTICIPLPVCLSQFVTNWIEKNIQIVLKSGYKTFNLDRGDMLNGDFISRYNTVR